MCNNFHSPNCCKTKNIKMVTFTIKAQRNSRKGKHDKGICHLALGITKYLQVPKQREQRQRAEGAQ